MYDINQSSLFPRRTRFPQARPIFPVLSWLLPCDPILPILYPFSHFWTHFSHGEPTFPMPSSFSQCEAMFFFFFSFERYAWLFPYHLDANSKSSPIPNVPVCSDSAFPNLIPCYSPLLWLPRLCLRTFAELSASIESSSLPALLPITPFCYLIECCVSRETVLDPPLQISTLLWPSPLLFPSWHFSVARITACFYYVLFSLTVPWLASTFSWAPFFSVTRLWYLHLCLYISPWYTEATQIFIDWIHCNQFLYVNLAITLNSLLDFLILKGNLSRNAPSNSSLQQLSHTWPKLRRASFIPRQTAITYRISRASSWRHTFQED